jgi:death-on-curing protein
MSFLYFDLSHAVQVHDDIIEKSGGFKGVLNLGLLESSLELVQNDSYYPGFIDKLTHLFFSINKNHSFQDGNKRSSIALSAYFLELNGWDFKISQFIREMENIAVDVADNRVDKELLSDIISSILLENDYPEELKLRIINAKSQIPKNH